MGSNEYDGNRNLGCGQFALEIQPTDARQSHIQNQAAHDVAALCTLELVDGRKKLYFEPHGSNETLDRSANRWVVIDDKNDWRGIHQDQS